jgi:hypothetical protein
MIPETPDPVLRGLAGLRTPVPNGVRAERVRSRCRKVLDTRRRRRESPTHRSPVARAVDLGCLVVLGVYLAEAVREAVRLGGLL